MGKRGLAFASEEVRQRVASLGGQAAHKSGKAYKFTPEMARIAGKKGGKAVSKDRAHMARIGRIGGLRNKVIPK